MLTVGNSTSRIVSGKLYVPCYEKSSDWSLIINDPELCVPVRNSCGFVQTISESPQEFAIMPSACRTLFVLISPSIAEVVSLSRVYGGKGSLTQGCCKTLMLNVKVVVTAG